MGTVYKRGDTWTYKAELPRDPISNKRRQIAKGGFRTKAEATKAMNQLEGEVATGSHKGSTAYTLDEWAQICLAKTQRTQAANTHRAYRNAWERHLSPRLGHLRLGNVANTHIATALDACLVEDHLAVGTVEIAEITIRSFFREAIRRGLVDRSPVVNVSPTPQSEAITRDDVWTPEEARSFLAHVTGHYLEPIVTLTLSTGLRFGEMRGLQWSDINFDQRILRVERQMDHYGLTTRLPKYDSRRTVPFGAHTAAALKQRRSECDEARAAFGDTYVGDFVFCLPDGRPRGRGAVFGAWKRALKKWGGKPIKFHGLRHTFATEALARGTSPKVVAEVLGHKDPSITLRVYAHVAPHDWQSVGDRMDGLFG